MKKIPYGKTDFPYLIRNNYYYVDKTQFIEQIELMPDYLFLIRPRRFGKSLTLAMLETYYDIRYAAAFDELFDGLYIGQHPTPLHNKFLIMRFNFSEVSSKIEETESSFRRYCCGVMRDFVDTYIEFVSVELNEKIKDITMPGEMLSVIHRHITMIGGLHTYLMIDEYDNFTNTILSTYGTEHYQKATHGEGFIREFFNVIKAATTGPGAAVERLFITGVSPVTMDDVTSGFNIGTNITTDPRFNALVGFSKTELHAMLTYYKEEGAFEESVEQLIEWMKPNYDNYHFSEYCLNEPMFNSDMVLYFLDYYLGLKQKPKDLIDPNIRMDFNKLSYLVRLDHGLEQNFSVIKEIAEQGELTTDIATHFSALDMTNPVNFKSLLFYFGLLSIKGADYAGTPILHVPNVVVREQLFNFLINGYQKHDIFSVDLSRLSQLMKEMAFTASWQPVFHFLGDAVRDQSRIREFIEGEAHVKGFILAYLNMFRYFLLYAEHEMNKGFADFYFRPNPAAVVTPPYTFLLEVKYAKAGAKDIELRALADEAAEQLRQYAADELVAKTRAEGKLRLITIVWRSWELVLMEEVF